MLRAHSASVIEWVLESYKKTSKISIPFFVYGAKIQEHLDEQTHKICTERK